MKQQDSQRKVFIYQNGRELLTSSDGSKDIVSISKFGESVDISLTEIGSGFRLVPLNRILTSIGNDGLVSDLCFMSTD